MRKPTRKASGDLEERIATLEMQKTLTEQRVSTAFTRGDHAEGARVARDLDRLKAQLDELYDQWAARGG